MQVPTGFKEENFHADGTFELRTYNYNAGPIFEKDGQDFETPVLTPTRSSDLSV